MKIEKKEADRTFISKVLDQLNSPIQRRKSPELQLSDLYSLVEGYHCLLEDYYGQPQKPAKERLGD